MELIKKCLYVTLLIPISFFLFSTLAAEQDDSEIKNHPLKVNKALIKKPPTLSAAESNKLRQALLKDKVEYSDYMKTLKAHRDKVKESQMIRTTNKARARTNIRSQNTKWEGTYDCDDMKANVNPGAQEVCDGIDNDCNGEVDDGVTANLFLDADGDGWGDPKKPIKACHVEDGYAARGNDCDDRNILIYPGAADEEGDGIDANCDGKDG